jgi:acetyl-CoA C-acetyltransferase
MRAAALGALAHAGIRLDEIDAFDLYSCFPSAVEMACDMLGLAEDDPRGLTVTGGLPYAGGPGNAYTLHALAAMAECVRARPGAKGLVTGNGWYVTKHAALVVASAPRPERAGGDAPPPAEPRAAEPEPVTLREEAEGPAHVETYTVGYDREGAPARGIVVGRLDDGSRFLANTPKDRALLEDFVKHDALGRPGRVERRDGRNCFLPK